MLVLRRPGSLAPNRLCVADFAYVSTWTGLVYATLVIAALSPAIVGWRADKSMTTALVLDALLHPRPGRSAMRAVNPDLWRFTAADRRRRRQPSLLRPTLVGVADVMPRTRLVMEMIADWAD